MNTVFINIIFLIFTLIIFFKIIGYGLYEIKQENNFYGGIVTIMFSLVSIIFCNIMIWIWVSFFY
jgi:hypothetical protein